MKKKLIDWNLDEPTVTKHFKGHSVSNLTVIFNAHVYGTVTLALRNQLRCKRNGEAVDEEEVTFISLKSCEGEE